MPMVAHCPPYGVTLWQFVDTIAAVPTVRLDLNASPLFVTAYDISPPPVNKVRVSSAMRDGGPIPSATYSNRVISLDIRLTTSSADAGATQLQNLARELDRDYNILKLHIGGASAPVFFRTFGLAEYTLQVVHHLIEKGKAVLKIDAEPFGYGLREAITPVTVSNDPAAVTNPMRFDVAGVKGDVAAPLLMEFTGTGTGGVGNKQSVFAVRRRGDPTALDPLIQAESMTTVGADTTVSAAGADAAMSGATNDYIRTTFATLATLSTRATKTFPSNGVAIADARGTYKVFGRYRKSAAGTAGDMTVRFGYGDTAATLIFNDSVLLPAGAGPAYVDLGYMSVPLGHDPREFGVSGTDLKVLMNTVAWQAGRNSGALTLDLDFLYFVPAGPYTDDRLALVDWPTKDTTYLADAMHDMALALNPALDTILGTEAPAAGPVGGLPYVGPNQTNRIYFIRDVTPGQSDSITNTTVIAPYYFPMYYSVRPSAT